MAETTSPRLGEIVIDRMTKGRHKVTCQIFHPTTGKPEVLSTDVFPGHGRADHFAQFMGQGMGFPIIDRTRENANEA